jgi:hypothetical protein
VEEHIKNKLKVDALLREYTEIRHDSRTYDVLKIMCITLSALVVIILLIAGISFKNYILIFIAPLVSIFFILLTMGMQVYSTTLGLRANQIEDLLKNIIGEPTIQFESTVGIFVTATEDVFTTQVGRYWFIISVLVIIVGISPMIVSLLYGFMELHNNVSTLIWFIVGLDIFAGLATLYIGYRFFFKRGWEKLKLSI